MQAPEIDGRSYEDILKQIQKMVPYYTPEWNFDDKSSDSGAALARIFAAMLSGTVKRLNQVPGKNFIEFLNMLNIKQIPARHARVPLTFKLSSGTTQNVFIPSGTEVSSVSDSGEPVVFQTENSLMAAPAKIVSAYWFNGRQDHISEIPSEIYDIDKLAEHETNCTALFDLSGDNKQSHELYIGDTELLNIKTSSTLCLSWDMEGMPNDLRLEDCIRFYYYGEVTQLNDDKKEGWHEIEAPVFSNGRWRLNINAGKNMAFEIKEHEVDGINSRWIKAVAEVGAINKINNIRIKSIMLSDNWSSPSMVPEIVFKNDVPVTLSGTIYPFGDTPHLYDTFYIGSDEAFSKKGTQITVRFKANTVDAQDMTAKLSWEYWNGTAWVGLGASNSVNKDFIKTGDAAIPFTCPEDMSKVLVNGIEKYWVRARLADGDYGREALEEVNVAPGNTQNGNNQSQTVKKYILVPRYKAPCFSTVTIDVASKKAVYFKNYVTYNNLEYCNVTDTVKAGSTSVRAFPTLDCECAAISIGFDMKLMKGPLSVFFHLGEQLCPVDLRPGFRWEYCNKSGEWSALKLSEDGTNSLTKSGAVVFAGAEDFTAKRLFGKELYWIRAVDNDNSFSNEGIKPPFPILKGILNNTVWACEAETHTDEILGSGKGNQHEQYYMSKKPVLSESIWINEAGKLSEMDMKNISDSKKCEFKEVKDSAGGTREFWVKWINTEDFLNSDPYDRHYTIDRAQGAIAFGDGINGAVPPIGNNNIKTDYKSGGGKKGNVGEGALKELKTSIAFVDSVINILPAEGGFDNEAEENVLLRGPKLIKHRNRAITAEDYEWIVLQYSRDVARVKCISNFNDKLAYESGWITLVIIPESTAARPVPSLSLRNSVSEYVKLRSPDCIAFNDHINVIGPEYIEVSVDAVLCVQSIDDMPLVELAAQESLNFFLHPRNGGNDGKGWDFGRLPHLSDFYPVLEQVKGVDHIEDITVYVNAGGEVYTFRHGLQDEFEMPELMPHVLVCSGKHTINVDFD